MSERMTTHLRTMATFDQFQASNAKSIEGCATAAQVVIDWAKDLGVTELPDDPSPALTKAFDQWCCEIQAIADLAGSKAAEIDRKERGGR